jgi:hypothetical protein
MIIGFSGKHEKGGMILGVVMTLALVMMFVSCGSGSDDSIRTITAGTLADKYRVSVEAARREFDGKELLVEGYVLSVVAVPKSDEGEGVILLGPSTEGSIGVQCWFTRYESAEFAGLSPGSSITVKGVFNGETGPVLKFCKLEKRPVENNRNGT